MCVGVHTYHIRNYIIDKNILSRVLVLMMSSHGHLVLCKDQCGSVFGISVGLYQDQCVSVSGINVGLYWESVWVCTRDQCGSVSLGLYLDLYCPNIY